MDAAGRRQRARTALAVARRRASTDGAVDGMLLPDWLTVGVLVVDTTTGRKGTVQDWPYPVRAPTRAWIRPVGGGLEWTPRIADLRRAEGEDKS